MEGRQNKQTNRRKTRGEEETNTNTKHTLMDRYKQNTNIQEEDEKNRH